MDYFGLVKGSQTDGYTELEADFKNDWRQFGSCPQTTGQSGFSIGNRKTALSWRRTPQTYPILVIWPTTGSMAISCVESSALTYRSLEPNDCIATFRSIFANRVKLAHLFLEFHGAYSVRRFMIRDSVASRFGSAFLLKEASMDEPRPIELCGLAAAFVDDGHGIARRFRVLPRFANNMVILKQVCGAPAPAKQSHIGGGHLTEQNEWGRRPQNGHLTLNERCLDLPGRDGTLLVYGRSLEVPARPWS